MPCSILVKCRVINFLKSRYLGHDGDPLSVDSTEHSVFEEDGEVSLCRLLEGEDGSSLEPREEALTGEVLAMWRKVKASHLKSCMLLPATLSATSLTSLEKGSFGMRRLVDF